MTQNSIPPQMQGHVEGPNPLELFWERNRKSILIVLTIVALGIGGMSLQDKLERDARDARVSELMGAAALDRGYATEGDTWASVQSQLANNPQALAYSYVPYARTELVSDLDEDLKRADRDELAEIAGGDDSRAPLALWLLVAAAVAEDDWEVAEENLQQLEQRFPDHFLCRQSPHPVQYLPQKPSEDEEAEETGSDEAPEYEEPAAGSPVAMLRQAIADERQFRAEHPELYTIPEPTSEETIVFEIENAGEIAVKLYDEAAPEHAAKILELARDGWWEGLYVHEIRRQPEGSMFASMMPAEGEFRLGWESTRDADPSAWAAGTVDEEHLLDWESTDISHFPGMVAVESAPEGKSQVERLAFTSADVAGKYDGRRIVVGRVVRGMDIVEQITSASFAETEAVQRGSGRPQTDFRVADVRVE